MVFIGILRENRCRYLFNDRLYLPSALNMLSFSVLTAIKSEFNGFIFQLQK